MPGTDKTTAKKRAAKTKTIGENYILSYYQAIREGTVVVGKWVRLVYEYIIRAIEEKRLEYDGKKAHKAIDYIESHCYHTEGPLAPGLLKLELWQKAFVSCVFGLIDPETKNRAFREIVLLVGRKNGKSALASAIAKYTFAIDGGYGTRIYCIAPKLDQAEIIYNNIWQMYLIDPEWGAMEKDDPARARHRMTDYYLAATNSTVKKIAFSAKKSDGFNPSLTVCDEVASWPGVNGLKQYEVMKSGMGARPEGLMLSCTTSGYENDGIFDELIKRSTRFLMGDSKERRLLPFLYMIDDLDKWNDINELRKSNPNLGVSVSVDYLLDEIAVAEGSLSKKAEFIVKYCNIKQNASTAWLSAPDVEKMSGDALSLADFRECYCVGGIDLSQTRDLTACLAVVERRGEIYVFAKFFLPGAKIDEAAQRDGVPYNIYIQRGLLQPSGDNYVDYRDCYNWFIDLVKTHHIYPLKIGYDRYSAQYLVQDMAADGFHMDDVFQGENLYGVIQEVTGLVEDGKIHIGDNDLLKMHLLNGAIKMSSERGRGRLVKINSNLHIDGAAALLDAFAVRQKYALEVGDRLQNKGR